MSKQLHQRRNTSSENSQFKTALGNCNISLPFKQSQGAGQAWSQADCYAINAFNDHFDDMAIPRSIALINDSYGALFAALHLIEPLSCESYTDEASQAFNYEHNNLSTANIRSIVELKDCRADVAIIKIPKQLDYFELILAMLSQAKSAKGEPIVLIITGMQKYLSKNFYQLIEKYLGDNQVLPGVKKAKCIMATTQPELGKTAKPFNVDDFIYPIDLPEHAIHLYNLPNVFSRQQLDIGTRFFIQNFPEIADNECFLDLACGNGALTLYALNRAEHLTAYACDNSALALASLNIALKNRHVDGQLSSIVQTEQLNCLFATSIAKASLDIVVCNPPFHQGHNVSDHIAHTMIMQSRELLKPEGRLYIIGNRHLNYDVALKKYFKKVSLHAANDKFSIFKATL